LITAHGENDVVSEETLSSRIESLQEQALQGVSLCHCSY
jgi:hypothetical protein